MRSKFLPVLKALIFVVGAASLQACFYGRSYGPAYGPDPYAYRSGPAYAYGPPPSYGYTRDYVPPPRVGDYDDHHQWHDRDWWVQNNHPWVQQHHPDWMEHGHNHDRDYH